MHFYGTNILYGCVTNVAGSSVFRKDIVLLNGGKERRSIYHKSSLKILWDAGSYQSGSRSFEIEIQSA